jgi:para-nitrobenzyl esterase
MHVTPVRALPLLVLALAACAPEARAPAPQPDPASLRRIDQGELVGFVGRYGSHAWLGIPYAKPPVAALRWRAPERPEAWTGTRQALAHGNVCPQLTSPFGGVPGPRGTVVGDEDCLVLDVYAPRLAADAVPRAGRQRMPVLFWIHGGGNVIGHTGFYDGGQLAESQHVVVVAAQYRLGPLGWLRHASLREGSTSPDEASGNFGTLDLIRALAWVQHEIAAFGGDPDDVTIFGESAGGHDVYTLLLSPRAKGLFHRAISESGSTRLTSAAEAEHFADDPEPGAARSSNEVLLALLQKDGVAADRTEARAHLAGMAPEVVAAYLRGKTPAELLSVYTGDRDEGLLDMPRVFADGRVLPTGAPLEHFAAGRWNQVPVILGTNRDENKLFLFADPRWVRRWLGFLPRLRDPEAYELVAHYLASTWKADGADEPADAMRRKSRNVWVYRFDWDEEPSRLGADLSAMLGAAHGFEIPFVFGHFDLGRRGNVIFDDANRAGREALSTAMMSYWVQFAAKGAPARGRDGTLPEWTAWQRGAGAPKFMVLDTEAGGGLRMSSESLTAQGVWTAAQNDPRLVAREDRCALLAEIARWSDERSAAPDCEASD